jgi:hypothetical protein
MQSKIPPEYEKVWKYFEKRKTPVSVKRAALGASTNAMHARRALEYFVFAELAIRSQTGNEFFYRIKR